MSQNISEPLSPSAKGNFYRQTPELSAECQKRNACVNLHPLKHDYLKGHLSPRFRPEPSSEALRLASESKPGPSTLNEGLVPVRSPSEGLSYKPYIGSYPPPTGSLAPIYCSPSVGRVFVNMISSVPTSNQLGDANCITFFAPGQSHLLSYTVPIAGTSSSRSAVEQNSLSATPRQKGHGQFLSSYSNNYTATLCQSSCNTISQKNVMPSDVKTDSLDMNKSDFQGCTASSPCEKVQGVLSLFLAAPTIRKLHQHVPKAY